MKTQNKTQRKPQRKGKGGKDTQALNQVNSKQLNKANSSKNERRFKEVEDTVAERYFSKSNPYTWYAAFPNFSKDVATLAFGLPVGQPLDISGDGDYIASAGIMSLHFTPTPGYSADLTSPINRQAARFYTYLRSIQRAAATYDAADLMMYMMAIDSLYTYWAYLRRAYGVAQLFTPTNKYYPRRLLQAMQINPSIALNLADFRAYINRFALNIGRFAIPSEFDIIHRHMWMTSGLYLDSDTTRAQTYMFVPSYLYQYDNTVTTGSQLTGVQISSFGTTPTQRTLNELQSLGDTLLNALENDEDTMNISGDIFRAFEGRLFHVEETPENFAVLPTFDKVVLSQIENATLVGQFSNAAGAAAVPVITQDPTVNSGAIKFEPRVQGRTLTLSDSNFGANPALVFGSAILNAHEDSPSPESVMEMTRLTAVRPSVPIAMIGPNTGLLLDNIPADLINYIMICETNPDNPSSVRFIIRMNNGVYINTATGTLDGTTTGTAHFLSAINQFDWAPMLYLVDYSGTTANVESMIADLDNFTKVSSTQLHNIHEAAMLSLLDLPAPQSK